MSPALASRAAQVEPAGAEQATFRAVTAADLDYVLGLGSNLGDRLGFFRSAAQELARHGRITAFSALYETPPLGPAQPDYLNGALRFQTTLEPLAMLELGLAIEQTSGRVRRERWGPRTLDVDLLFIFGRTVAIPGLVVPHRELTERAFALIPLLDVAPEARDPVSGALYAELVLRLDRTGVRELPNTRAGWLE